MGMFNKIRHATSGLKMLLTGQVRFPSQSMIWFDTLDRPTIDDIAQEVGDGTSSDVLMTPIRWIQRAVTEAPLMAFDKEGSPVEGHKLVDLISSPNPYYSFSVLLAGTVLDLCMGGNAYWIIARNGNGNIAEFWYAPASTITPKWKREKEIDSQGRDRAPEFIDHYEYRTGGEAQKLDPETDVIHFRDGVDPRNLRLGLSPLKALLRSVWTDQEAALFTAVLLKNGGVPGLVLSPANPEATIDKDEAEAAEAKIESKVTRANRGRLLVMRGPTKLEQFGFNPKELDLSPLRDVSEERVTAALGVQAAVVGFGAGLQQTKVGATMRELRQLSYHNGVLPLWRIIGSQITRTLAKDLGNNVKRIGFDTSVVEALQEDADSRFARVERAVRAGILTRSEARAELGYESEKGDDVYLLSLTTIEVPVGTLRTDSLAGGKGREIKAHAHSLLEERLIETTPKHDVPAVANRYYEAVHRIRTAAIDPMAERLLEVFGKLAEQTYSIALDILGEKSAGQGETKDDAHDSLNAERMRARIDQEIADIERALTHAFEVSYLSVADDVIKQIGEIFGLEISITDQMQVAILREGGTRAGLLDLSSQAKDAIFEALAEGRRQGLAGDNLARHIRDRVEAGPWRDAMTRARTIARTEGAHAANTSTIEAATSMGFNEFMVLDNRTGFNDEVCSEINGHIVSAQEAQALGLAHPNCTRSFTPITPKLREELGLAT